MRALLLILALAPLAAAEESLAERIVRLRAKVESKSASANERYELATELRRAGREDLALEIALELTREPGFEPWAQYLVGQLRFHADPGGARVAFARARDGARALGEPGLGLAREASAAVASCEQEERRGDLLSAAESRIRGGLWGAALAWIALLAVALRLTRTKAEPSL
ncbi:MAG: hypothetical protein JNM84_09675 [Planctomycetes bacterium]|nr:hypothetical protein [Planctomycetota bacterium]